MEAICKELDDTKTAMEQLKADYYVKTEITNSLRKAHDEQLVKIQETKLQMEKQAQELNAKAEEIAVARGMYEDLRSSLHEKESMLKHLSSTSDQIRSSYREKLEKLEEENRELVLVLNKTKEKCEDQEGKIQAHEKEIEALKHALFVSQKKCSDAEQRVQVAETTIKKMASELEMKAVTLAELSENKVKTEQIRIQLVEFEKNFAKETSLRVAAQKSLAELRQRDDMLLKLEHENGKLGDQLKWKREQFDHLEEAHMKLQDQFRIDKRESEAEKNRLIDEICLLRTDLDSQTRMLEDVRSRLQICNQALAHEESRRKLLEIQVDEFKISYENVFVEFQEARSKIESLTIQRDEQIAFLRSSLTTKAILFKEMEFKQTHLEHENQKLQNLVKELQEAQINEAGTANSMSKLRNKLKVLEQVHRDCSRTLKSKEAEWNSLTEKLASNLEDCKCELDSKDKHIQELQSELESCESSLRKLMLQNEEISIALLVYRSEFSQAISKTSSFKLEMESCSEKREEQITLLKEQLELKNSALLKAQAEIEQECKTKEGLIERIDSFDVLELQCALMQKELDRNKELLEEMAKSRGNIQEQASQKENALKEDLKRTLDALEKSSSDLAQKTYRMTEMDFELQRLEEIVERLKAAKLDSEVKSKIYESQIGELLTEKESAILANREIKQRFEQEMASFLQITEMKSMKLEDLQQKILVMEEISRSMENAVCSKHEEKLSEFNSCFEVSVEQQQMVMENFSSAMILAQLEIQSIKSLIDDQEEEIESLKQKLELEEELLFDSKQLAGRLQIEMDIQKNEKYSELAILKDELRCEKEAVEEHRAGILKLREELEISREAIGGLLSEREELVSQMARLSEKMEEFSDHDSLMVRSFGSILEMVTSGKENEAEENLEGERDLSKSIFSSKKDDRDEIILSSKLTQEGSSNNRSPLKVLNS